MKVLKNILLAYYYSKVQPIAISLVERFSTSDQRENFSLTRIDRNGSIKWHKDYINENVRALRSLYVYRDNTIFLGGEDNSWNIATMVVA